VRVEADGESTVDVDAIVVEEQDLLGRAVEGADDVLVGLAVGLHQTDPVREVVLIEELAEAEGFELMVDVERVGVREAGAVDAACELTKQRLGARKQPSRPALEGLEELVGADRERPGLDHPERELARGALASLEAPHPGTLEPAAPDLLFAGLVHQGAELLDAAELDDDPTEIEQDDAGRHGDGA
jgi:hypothetical protein